MIKKKFALRIAAGIGLIFVLKVGYVGCTSSSSPSPDGVTAAANCASQIPTPVGQNISSSPKILWQRCEDPNTNCDVWAMNFNGTEATNLTPGTSCSIDFDMQYSSDHSKIVFSSTRGGNPDIWVMNSDGSNVIQLTTSNLFESFASFSPDGSKIVFSRAGVPDGKIKLHLMNVDGSNVQRIRPETEAGEEEEAAFSPDGSKILFDSNRTGVFKLYLIKPDGSGFTAITPAGACGGASIENRYPSWSPNGSKIVFGCTATGNNELYVMNSDGSGVVQITNNPGQINSDPAWSSDGNTIVFATTRDGNPEIYSVRPDGSNQTRLTNSSVFDAGPFAW